MFCTKCGAELPEGVKFCTSCGAPVKVVPGMAQQTAQSVPDPETFVPAPEVNLPPEPAAAPKKKKKKIWPIVLTLSLIALIAAAVCAVLFVPALHDMVFGVEELSFNESKLELCVGDKLDLTDALEAGDREAGDLKWSSSDEDIATVKNGVVTAVAAGDCRITVEDKDHEDVSDEVRLTVYEKVLYFDEDEISLEVGDTEDIVSEYLYYDHIDFSEPKFKSSDDAVVSVSDDGTVEAKQSGSAVITVEADGMTASMTVTVEAEELDPADVAAQVEQIRDWYYHPGSTDVRREVASGENGWNYGREYLFHDGELVFAYVHAGTDQSRLYFQNGKLIFVIDADRNELTGSDLDSYLSMADQAKSDAQNYAP